MDSNNLMQALYAMDWERIKAELNAGADINAPYNKHGWTPFIWACREFYEPEAIEAFLAAGGDVNSLYHCRQAPEFAADIVGFAQGRSGYQRAG